MREVVALLWVWLVGSVLVALGRAATTPQPSMCPNTTFFVLPPGVTLLQDCVVNVELTVFPTASVSGYTELLVINSTFLASVAIGDGSGSDPVRNIKITLRNVTVNTSSPFASHAFSVLLSPSTGSSENVSLEVSGGHFEARSGSGLASALSIIFPLADAACFNCSIRALNTDVVAASGVSAVALSAFSGSGGGLQCVRCTLAAERVRLVSAIASQSEAAALSVLSVAPGLFAIDATTCNATSVGVVEAVSHSDNAAVLSVLQGDVIAEVVNASGLVLCAIDAGVLNASCNRNRAVTLSVFAASRRMTWVTALSVTATRCAAVLASAQSTGAAVLSLFGGGNFVCEGCVLTAIGTSTGSVMQALGQDTVLVLSSVTTFGFAGSHLTNLNITAVSIHLINATARGHVACVLTLMTPVCTMCASTVRDVQTMVGASQEASGYGYAVVLSAIWLSQPIATAFTNVTLTVQDVDTIVSTNPSASWTFVLSFAILSNATMNCTACCASAVDVRALDVSGLTMLNVLTAYVADTGASGTFTDLSLELRRVNRVSIVATRVWAVLLSVAKDNFAGDLVCLHCTASIADVDTVSVVAATSRAVMLSLFATLTPTTVTAADIAMTAQSVSEIFVATDSQYATVLSVMCIVCSRCTMFLNNSRNVTVSANRSSQLLALSFVPLRQPTAIAAIDGASLTLLHALELRVIATVGFAYLSSIITDPGVVATVRLVQITVQGCGDILVSVSGGNTASLGSLLSIGLAASLTVSSSAIVVTDCLSVTVLATSLAYVGAMSAGTSAKLNVSGVAITALSVGTMSVITSLLRACMLSIHAASNASITVNGARLRIAVIGNLDVVSRGSNTALLLSVMSQAGCSCTNTSFIADSSTGQWAVSANGYAFAWSAVSTTGSLTLSQVDFALVATGGSVAVTATGSSSVGDAGVLSIRATGSMFSFTATRCSFTASNITAPLSCTTVGGGSGGTAMLLAAAAAGSAMESADWALSNVTWTLDSVHAVLLMTGTDTLLLAWYVLGAKLSIVDSSLTARNVTRPMSAVADRIALMAAVATNWNITLSLRNITVSVVDVARLQATSFHGAAVVLSYVLQGLPLLPSAAAPSCHTCTLRTRRVAQVTAWGNTSSTVLSLVSNRSHQAECAACLITIDTIAVIQVATANTTRSDGAMVLTVSNLACSVPQGTGSHNGSAIDTDTTKDPLNVGCAIHISGDGDHNSVTGSLSSPLNTWSVTAPRRAVICSVVGNFSNATNGSDNRSPAVLLDVTLHQTTISAFSSREGGVALIFGMTTGQHSRIALCNSSFTAMQSGGTATASSIPNASAIIIVGIVSGVLVASDAGADGGMIPQIGRLEVVDSRVSAAGCRCFGVMPTTEVVILRNVSFFCSFVGWGDAVGVASNLLLVPPAMPVPWRLAVGGAPASLGQLQRWFPGVSPLFHPSRLDQCVRGAPSNVSTMPVAPLCSWCMNLSTNLSRWSRSMSPSASQLPHCQPTECSTRTLSIAVPSASSTAWSVSSLGAWLQDIPVSASNGSNVSVSFDILCASGMEGDTADDRVVLLAVHWDESVRGSNQTTVAVRRGVGGTRVTVGRDVAAAVGDMIRAAPGGSSAIDGSMSGLYWYSPHRLALDVMVVCGPNGNRTLTVDPVTIGAIELPLSRTATTAGAVANWVSAISASSSGASVSRMTVTRRIMLCSASDASNGGLFGLSIGDGGTCPWLAYARGAAMGNMGALAAAAFLLVVSGALWSLGRPVMGCRMTPKCMLRGALRVALPSSLLPLWILTVGTSSGSVVLLLSHSCSDVTAADVILGLLCCLLQLVAPLSMMIYMVCGGRCGGRVFPFGLRLQVVSASRQPRTPHETRGREALLLMWCVRLRLVIRHVTQRHVAWHVTPPTAEGEAADMDRLPLHRCIQNILLEYRTPWYAVVDAINLVALGALGATSGLTTTAGCRWISAVVVALCALQCALGAVARPFTSHFALAHHVISLLLVTMSGAAQLYAVSGASYNTEAALTAAAACDLMVSAISFVKAALVDIPSTLTACRGFVGELLRRRRAAVVTVSNGEGDDEGASLSAEGTPVQPRSPATLLTLLPAEAEEDDDNDGGGGRDRHVPWLISAHHDIDPVSMEMVHPPKRVRCSPDDHHDRRDMSSRSSDRDATADSASDPQFHTLNDGLVFAVEAPSGCRPAPVSLLSCSALNHEEHLI